MHLYFKTLHWRDRGNPKATLHEINYFGDLADLAVAGIVSNVSYMVLPRLCIRDSYQFARVSFRPMPIVKNLYLANL